MDKDTAAKLHEMLTRIIKKLERGEVENICMVCWEKDSDSLNIVNTEEHLRAIAELETLKFRIIRGMAKYDTHIPGRPS